MQSHKVAQVAGYVSWQGRRYFWLHSGIGQAHMLNSEFASSQLESPSRAPLLDGAIGWTLHSIKAIYTGLCNQMGIQAVLLDQMGL